LIDKAPNEKKLIKQGHTATSRAKLIQLFELNFVKIALNVYGLSGQLVLNSTSVFNA
jgi:hypothetical protein